MAHAYMIVLGFLHLAHLGVRELLEQNRPQKTACVVMEILIGVVYVVGGLIFIADLII